MTPATLTIASSVVPNGQAHIKRAGQRHRGDQHNGCRQEHDEQKPVDGDAVQQFHFYVQMFGRVTGGPGECEKHKDRIVGLRQAGLGQQDHANAGRPQCDPQCFSGCQSFTAQYCRPQKRQRWHKGDPDGNDAWLHPGCGEEKEQVRENDT